MKDPGGADASYAVGFAVSGAAVLAVTPAWPFPVAGPSPASRRAAWQPQSGQTGPAGQSRKEMA